jgi:hypothetical protein
MSTVLQEGGEKHVHQVLLEWFDSKREAIVPTLFE